MHVLWHNIKEILRFSGIRLNSWKINVNKICFMHLNAAFRISVPKMIMFDVQKHPLSHKPSSWQTITLRSAKSTSLSSIRFFIHALVKAYFYEYTSITKWNKHKKHSGGATIVRRNNARMLLFVVFPLSFIVRIEYDGQRCTRCYPD